MNGQQKGQCKAVKGSERAVKGPGCSPSWSYQGRPVRLVQFAKGGPFGPRSLSAHFLHSPGLEKIVVLHPAVHGHQYDLTPITRAVELPVSHLLSCLKRLLLR